ncbi:putative purine nucleoside phosphorylase [Schizosaccharomyces pombe]|uniref:Putative purine nucleoside phosphorylase n=1 Tax=Schizosaccharomyces pombe (strain 972 / ATCC 24843) TaxID=284812 RepID=PNPH_SCHPO|nr:putative purine nucleoside phosphorylase [Schizosaccharomyces pombe]Q9UTG1.1 RecName: Full=Putative purine nucleoside phosphorylase; Short=PNP; AltName: Full=Inosine phosphorylase; AltName: Full=Inosine-guanosine phosphorylase [Schizosaccharomyces pombe 972h-]CAB55857.1 purine nucleoside phosphorylase (predicted) [Schizosaccharomyces pombe]|eukprot:NP_593927.1 putative purine nucleoside phosphorylase [Schizosaccharomyces pombe]
MTATSFLHQAKQQPHHTEPYIKALEAREYIIEQVPEELSKPKVAIICGSGLGTLASGLSAPVYEVPYEDIPHFHVSHVPGHASKLYFAFLGEKRVPTMILAGRYHSYEGYPIEATTFPVRLMKVMGVEVMVVTNAAGGLNQGFKVGDLMILKDHINFPGLAGMNPLRGPNAHEFGVRFPPLSDAYDLELRKLVYDAAKAHKVSRTIHEGCYAFVSGPCFETRAESRMLALMGADCVGMSTVPEVVVARHCGIRVLAISLVTNNVVVEESPSAKDLVEVDSNVMSKGAANHLEVLEVGIAAAADVRTMVETIVNFI